MNVKEKILACKLLELARNEFANHGCNDVHDSIYDSWTIEERRLFVKEFHEYNGDPEEYNENFLHIPDYALMGFLAYKLVTLK